MTFVRNTIISVMLYGLTTLLNLGISAVVARGLGPAGQGAYALLMLFGVIVTLVINFGLGQSAVYFVGRGTYLAQHVASNLMTLSWLIGVAAALMLVVAQPWYAPLAFKSIPTEFVLAVVLLTPFALGRMYAEYMFVALQNFAWSSGLNIVDLILRLVLLLILLPAGAGLKGAVAAIVVGTVVSTVVGWALIQRRLGRLRGAVDRALIKDFSAYGVRSYVGVFMNYLNLRFDQFLIGFFLTLDQVGIYSIAVVIAEVAMKFSSVVAKILFANVASLDADSATQLTGRTMRVTLVFATMSVLMLALLGPLLIRRFFGSAFASATVPLRLLLPGALLFNFTQVLYSDLAGRGLPGIGIFAALASLAVTVAGNLWLTPTMGVAGAALISSLAYGVGALIIVFKYLRATGQSLRTLLLVTGGDLQMIRDSVASGWRAARFQLGGV